MSKLFITGFPGFVGGRLVRELFKRDEKLEILALVQQKFLYAAETLRGKLYDEMPSAASRMQFVFGDITVNNLGLDEKALDTDGITGIFHLAAAYDLAVARDKGMQINVEGTRNVVDFASRCNNLTRFDYVSTAYVSGTHKGVFSEKDFNLGQQFKNFYEETKYLAEKIVRETKRLPWTIYQPGIVVGDSSTGETAKYDGPYYALLTMNAFPDGFPFPRIGSGRAEVNLVPIDFAVNAMAALHGDPAATGKTFHLTDPSPMKVAEIQLLFARSIGKHFLSYPLPPGLAKAAMKFKPVRSIYRMPYQLIDYLVHEVHYESSETATFLMNHKISCPKFTEYLPNLIKFFKAKSEEELQGILI